MMTSDGRNVRNDLTGKMFGNLSVIGYFGKENKREENLWTCVCKCGKILEIRQTPLLSSKRTSCGCGGTGKWYEGYRTVKNDLTGKRFGKLVVTSFGGISKNRNSLWICKCDCGNEKSLSQSDLLKVDTKSCGCLSLVGNKNDRLPYNQSAKNYVLKNYRLNGIGRGYSYNLPKEFAESLIESNCYYCGAAPDKKYRDFSYMGIDRVDNKKGYYVDNVVPCCSICNMAKRSLTVEKFKEWVYNVFDHMNARDIKYAR